MWDEVNWRSITQEGQGEGGMSSKGSQAGLMCRPRSRFEVRCC